MGRFWSVAARLLASRFILGVFVVPNVAFWLVTGLIPNSPEIMAFNLAVIGVSTVVIIAYGELIVTTVMSGQKQDSGDYIAAGIVWGFGALWLRSALSLAWRWLGQPAWILNSDAINGILFASFMAGLMHPAARGALKDGRVPTHRWVRIGIIRGLVVVAGMFLLHATDVLDGLRAYWTPNDAAPTRSSYVTPL